MSLLAEQRGVVDCGGATLAFFVMKKTPFLLISNVCINNMIS